jgi:hypothetical protein
MQRLYTGYTQKNGAVSLYSPLKPHHSFVYTLYVTVAREVGSSTFLQMDSAISNTTLYSVRLRLHILSKNDQPSIRPNHNNTNGYIFYNSISGLKSESLQAKNIRIV